MSRERDREEFYRMIDAKARNVEREEKRKETLERLEKRPLEDDEPETPIERYHGWPFL